MRGSGLWALFKHLFTESQFFLTWDQSPFDVYLWTGQSVCRAKVSTTTIEYFMYVVVQNVPYFNETKPNTNECSKSELKSLIKPTICSPHANKLWWMPRVPGLRVQVVTRRDSSVMCHTHWRLCWENYGTAEIGGRLVLVWWTFGCGQPIVMNGHFGLDWRSKSCSHSVQAFALTRLCFVTKVKRD